jgi:hypothetical protein
MDKSRVPLLCILEPFLAGNQLIVIPFVFVLHLSNEIHDLHCCAE